MLTTIINGYVICFSKSIRLAAQLHSQTSITAPNQRNLVNLTESDIQAYKQICKQLNLQIAGGADVTAELRELVELVRVVYSPISTEAVHKLTARRRHLVKNTLKGEK